MHCLVNKAYLSINQLCPHSLPPSWAPQVRQAHVKPAPHHTMPTLGKPKPWSRTASLLDTPRQAHLKPSPSSCHAKLGTQNHGLRTSPLLDTPSQAITPQASPSSHHAKPWEPKTMVQALPPSWTPHIRQAHPSWVKLRLLRLAELVFWRE